MLKTVEKLYVGTKYHEPLSVDKPPLSFMVCDNSNQETMKKWCKSHDYDGKSKEEVIHKFENVSQSGFKIVGIDGRWSSDREWIEIIDPRGFKLQIRVENVLNILLNDKIENGLIYGEYIWCKYHHTNYLVKVNSTDHKEAIKNTKRAQLKPIKKKDLIFGHMYKNKAGEESVYCGKHPDKYNEKKMLFLDDCYGVFLLDFKKSHIYIEDCGIFEGFKENLESNIIYCKEQIEKSTFPEDIQFRKNMFEKILQQLEAQNEI